MYALHDPSTPWIRRFTIFTDLVQREGNGEVKIQYRKAQAQRPSLAQPPPELGMALLRTVLPSHVKKTAITCMQLLTCTRTNPARNNLSRNREYAETSLSLSLHLYLSSPPLHFILTLTFGQ